MVVDYIEESLEPAREDLNHLLESGNLPQLLHCLSTCIPDKKNPGTVVAPVVS